MASEVGVLPSIKEEDIKIKWRLQPGKMLLVDLEEKRIISDDELKESLSSEFPYEKWINQDRIRLSSLRSKSKLSNDFEKLFNLQRCFGYSKEDIKFFLQPMMVDGQDPVDLWEETFHLRPYLINLDFYMITFFRNLRRLPTLLLTQ